MTPVSTRRLRYHGALKDVVRAPGLGPHFECGATILQIGQLNLKEVKYFAQRDMPESL